jgi:hypothetical protein
MGPGHAWDLSGTGISGNNDMITRARLQYPQDRVITPDREKSYPKSVINFGSDRVFR